MPFQDKNKFIEQVKNWLKLGEETVAERRERKLNSLFEGKSLSDFSKKIEEYKKRDEGVKIIFEDFFKIFKGCFDEIVAGSIEIQRPGKAIDSVSSISKVIYFLDFGYELFVSILLENFSSDEVKRYSSIVKPMDAAYLNLLEKRKALMSYLYPFSLGMNKNRQNTGAPEARSWLKNNKNRHALAGNRFYGTQDALGFVENLYRLGANKVLVDNISFEEKGGTYADSLIIRLPPESEKRQALFKVFNEELEKEGFELAKDKGENEFTLWWD